MIPIISINHHFGLSKKHGTQKCVDHHFANQNKSLTWGEIASFSDTQIADPPAAIGGKGTARVAGSALK